MSGAARAAPPGRGGGFRAFARDPLGFLEGLAREHGPVATFRIGPRRIWSLADPELVREVLVVRPQAFAKDRGLDAARVVLGEGLLTSGGERWRRHRRLVQPAFHAERLEAYARVMAARATARAARWRDGEGLDVAEEAYALALEIVAEALFGADVSADLGAIAGAVADAVDGFRIGRIPFAPLLDLLPVPSTLRVRRARRTLDAIVHRLVAERRARPGDDLVSRLLAARDEEGGPGLDDGEVRDEVMTLFLAGHETTANALAWTADLVGRNPAWEARLHAEVDALLGPPPGRDVRPEDLPRLDVTRRIVAEAMRLYPPAWTLARRALEDVPVGGFTVRRGETVIMSQWVIHRDARLFPEPLRFDPDRFLPERRAGWPRLAYFPFGAGPRICVGEGFAWAEATLALAAFARRARLEPLAPAPPVPVPRITLRPGGGVPVRVRLRG